MNSSYIYIITNQINGHKYVGQSSGGSDKYFGSGIALKKAIQKYGKQNFIKEIVEYCQATELNEKEIQWISKLNTYKGEGYNLTPGGDGWTKGMKHSKDTRDKLLENPSQRGKVRDEKTKQKIRESLAVYRNSLTQEERKQIYGKSGQKLKGRSKTFSEEHKKNLSIGQTGKPKSPRTPEHLKKIAEKHRKRVCKIDTVQETVVTTYQSIKEASELTGIPVSSICCACRGRQKTAGGFIWKYL